MWPGGAEAKHKGRDTPKDTPPDPNTETLTSSLDDLVASLREQMAADPNTEALTAALAAKDETIELLKQQLEAQTRANDENHRIIGALTERLALPSPETRGYGGGGSGGGRVAVGVGSLFGK
jgi:ABC-type transporter Mla subunit MlaD